MNQQYTTATGQSPNIESAAQLKNPAVWEELERLQVALHEYTQVLDLLIGKLDPLMVQPSVPETKAIPTPITGRLSTEIRVIREKVELMTQTSAILLGALEI